MSKKKKHPRLNYENLGLSKPDSNIDEIHGLESSDLEFDINELSEDVDDFNDANDDIFEGFEETEDLNKDLDDESEELMVIEEPEFIPYHVKIATGRVKYFAGPGVNYKILGFATRNMEFIIVEEQIDEEGSRWGKMRNAYGWLPLKYCKRFLS